MANPTPADVLVIGGGVIGLSVAWAAAEAGATVTVVDPQPGHGATWAAAGMLAPAGEAHFGEEDLILLNRQAALRWPDFTRRLEGATGQAIGYRTEGSVLVAVDPSDRAAVDDVLSFQQRLGLEARRLSARQCRTVEPLLAPGIRGGVELGDDHQVDNRALTAALLEAARLGGVEFVDDEVVAVEHHHGRAEAVALRSGGRRPAATVVLAAGAHSGQLVGLPEAARPPVRPVKGLTLRLRMAPGGPALRRTVRGLVHGRPCYLVPRADGTVVLGATVEERGFDLTVQAGAVSDLLDDGRRLVPALDEYELAESSTGLRPGSPDNAPLVGATALEGLIVATGHFRNGILLAPLTADEVLAILLHGRGLPGARGQAGPFAPFDPGRFQTTTRPGPLGDSHRGIPADAKDEGAEEVGRR